MIPFLWNGLVGCHRSPAPVESAAVESAPADPVLQATHAVVGPASWETPAPDGGRFTFHVPAGFAAAPETGWLVVVRHLLTRAELRVGQGPIEHPHPGFLLVFEDAGLYRSGPAGEHAGTETWVSRAIGGPTLVVMRSLDGSKLYTELEIPLHAEVTAWAAFQPVLANLRVSP